MNPKLQVIVDSIDFYQSTYPEDACILIFDLEKVVGYKRGEKIDLKIKLGETAEQHRNTTSVRAMRSGKFLRGRTQCTRLWFPLYRFRCTGFGQWKSHRCCDRGYFKLPR